MNNKRKRILKILILMLFIFSFIGISFYYKFKEKKEFEYSKKAKENLENILKEQNVNLGKEPLETDNVFEQSLGFSLINISDFLNLNIFTNQEQALSITNSLNMNFGEFPNIIKDLDKFSYEDYFKANKDTIYSIYGISSEEQFSKLISQTKEIGKLKDFSINIDSVEVDGNNFLFDVIINGEEGELALNLTVVTKSTSSFASIFIEER